MSRPVKFSLIVLPLSYAAGWLYAWFYPEARGPLMLLIAGLDWLVLTVSWGAVVTGTATGIISYVLIHRLTWGDAYRAGYKRGRDDEIEHRQALWNSRDTSRDTRAMKTNFHRMDR